MITNIIIIIIISFTQGIFTYIPETNYVPREYSVASILLLLFMVLTSPVPVLTLMYFYISTFRSMCAVPNMAVFCSSLTSCFPGMLLTYFLNDFEIVPVAPVITRITFVFTFHMRYISVVMSLYFRVFSAAFLITFLSPEIATSINIHVPFLVSRIMSLLLLLLLLFKSSGIRRRVDWQTVVDFSDRHTALLLGNLWQLLINSYGVISQKTGIKFSDLKRTSATR